MALISFYHSLPHFAVGGAAASETRVCCGNKANPVGIIRFVCETSPPGLLSLRCGVTKVTLVPLGHSHDRYCQA